MGTLLAALLAGQIALTLPGALAAALPLAGAYAFVCLSAWYVARSLPLRGTSIVRVAATALITSLVSSSVWLLLARGWMQVLAGRGWVRGGDIAALDRIVFGLGVLLYLLSLAVSYLLITFEETRAAEERALRGQVLAREAELRSLRAQIDPHFLFNSLHAVSALTTSDPAAARRMCLLLAEFLRASLALEGEERIPLSKELALVNRYLAVERARFGDRLQADVDAGDAAACLVPPLLLQPIVENAITHGVAHVVEGGAVRVRAGRMANRLSIVIENPCDPDRPRGTGTGVGLSNVRARLKAVHGGEGRLRVAEAGGVWRVELSMPAVTDGS